MMKAGKSEKRRGKEREREGEIEKDFRSSEQRERERFLEASRRFLLCLLQWMQQS